MGARVCPCFLGDDTRPFACKKQNKIRKPSPPFKHFSIPAPDKGRLLVAFCIPVVTVRGSVVVLEVAACVSLDAGVRRWSLGGLLEEIRANDANPAFVGQTSLQTTCQLP